MQWKEVFGLVTWLIWKIIARGTVKRIEAVAKLHFSKKKISLYAPLRIS